MTHRKYFAALLAAMLLVSAAGCGSKSDETAMPIANGSFGDNVPADAGVDVPAVEFAEEAEADYDAVGAADAAYSAGAEVRSEAAAIKSEAPKSEFSAMASVDEAGAIYDGDGAASSEYRPSAEVGVLTAGEWNDNSNWGFFTNLVNNDLIGFPSYGLDPTHRVTVNVTNDSGAPAVNAEVTLLDADGNVIWTAQTGKDGRAYLFETNGRTGVSVCAADATAALPEAEGGDGQGNAAKCSDRTAELTISEVPAAKTATQIMFIVDTTGSMGDEMLYLQSDFTALAREVGDASTEYAAVFYKDEGDSYVVRTEGFTTDVEAVSNALNHETANGGGDEPEAVADALTAGFIDTAWNTDAVKVAFLIYDAPPHDGRETELQTAIEAAAKQGIHLVPVVSSNSARETELFGRAAAIQTDGTYVFLTDDSGVGGAHLEPIIGDHEVEKLHDIIVRVIENYKQ
ncbi:MAG: VWA domain-containing protein [Oscillospiraceae bacterium]|nr:VWA domain-containing protein [Oscillospiraceae bacterium]